MTSRTVDLGQLLALSCHRKRAKSRQLKALMMGPCGRDHKLSQLAAERLVWTLTLLAVLSFYRVIWFCSLSPVWYILCCLQLTITQASEAGQGHKWSNYNFTSAFWHTGEEEGLCSGKNKIIYSLREIKKSLRAPKWVLYCCHVVDWMILSL